MPTPDKSRTLEGLACQAVGCRECFTQGFAKPAPINVAQPRWIGANYWTAKPRVVVLMLNPGGGGSTANANHEPCRQLIERFGAGSATLQDVFQQQRDEMPSWGRPRGKFLKFYLDGLGVSLDDIAFANIAWCSSAGDKYPPAMLRECFGRHTRRLLETLEPHVLVASGSDVHRFIDARRAEFGSFEVLRVPHFAHRGSKAAADELLQPAKATIAALRG